MKSWPIKSLGDIVEVKWGNTSLTKASYVSDGFAAFSASGKDGYLSFFEHDEKGIILSAIGANCGKCFLAGGQWTAIKNTITITKPSKDVCIPYLFLFLNYEVVWPKRGGGQPFISQGDARKLLVPVPPLPDQERIVALLNEADELRKLRATADHRIAALVPALFEEMFGNQKSDFERAKLEQVAEVVSGVAMGRKFNGQQPVEVSYLRVANVQAGYLDLSEIKKIQALPKEVTELALRKGDILLTEGGDFDKLGRGAMLEHDLPNCIHQNHIFRVRVREEVLNPTFFAEFLLTTEAREYFLSCAKRTTNLASINMRQLRALPVPLPPLALQNEFARKVREFREFVAVQTGSRNRIGSLFHSMLHKGFAGEL